MNETPVPPERTVVVANTGRLWTLTIISLLFNGLILFLIIVGAIIHHHRMKHHGFGGGRDGGGKGFCQECSQGGFQRHHFHHFGMDRGGRFGDDQSFGGQGRGEGNFGDRGGWGREGGPGKEEGGRGFGMGRHFGPGGGGPMDGMDSHDPAKMSDMVMDHLTKTLTLTDDQKAKIKPIVDASVAQFQKDAEAQHQAMQKQIEDTKAKIKPLLNVDQQKELDQLPVPGQKPMGADGDKDQPAAK